MRAPRLETSRAADGCSRGSTTSHGFVPPPLPPHMMKPPLVPHTSFLPYTACRPLGKYSRVLPCCREGGGTGGGLVVWTGRAGHIGRAPVALHSTNCRLCGPSSSSGCRRGAAAHPRPAQHNVAPGDGQGLGDAVAARRQPDGDARPALVAPAIVWLLRGGREGSRRCLLGELVSSCAVLDMARGCSKLGAAASWGGLRLRLPRSGGVCSALSSRTC